MNQTEIREKTDLLFDYLVTLQGTVHEKTQSYDVSMRQWSWPQGVALFAIWQYYCETGKRELLRYLESWFDQHLEAGLPPVDVNNTCPMLTMAYLYEHSGNPVYGAALEKWCHAAMAKLPRTEEGGFAHYITTLPNEGQLWDDTLYMLVLFLAKMAQLIKDDNLLHESIRQFLVHIKYLTDPITGLFFHGWSFPEHSHFSSALWGRGNSWYTAGLVDYLDMVQLPEGVKMVLSSALERQVRALSKYQHETGLWHTIITDSSTYLETSATSAFAYGILKAVRVGLLSPEFESTGLKAAKGVLSMIRDDGKVEGVSAGTPVFRTIEEYSQVERCHMPYGQSMAMLMLVELLKHQ